VTAEQYWLVFEIAGIAREVKREFDRLALAAMERGKGPSVEEMFALHQRLNEIANLAQQRDA